MVTLTDIVGRRVVVTSDSWRVLIHEMLSYAGLAPTGIIEVPGGFDMAPFYDGRVDIWAGFVTNEVIRARQSGLEVVTFPTYDYGVRRSHNLVFTSLKILESEPDKGVRFL